MMPSHSRLRRPNNNSDKPSKFQLRRGMSRRLLLHLANRMSHCSTGLESRIFFCPSLRASALKFGQVSETSTFRERLDSTQGLYQRSLASSCNSIKARRSSAPYFVRQPLSPFNKLLLGQPIKGGEDRSERLLASERL